MKVSKCRTIYEDLTEQGVEGRGGTEQGVERSSGIEQGVEGSSGFSFSR